jgi:diacylglycerol kinase (ATP)
LTSMTAALRIIVDAGSPGGRTVSVAESLQAALIDEGVKHHVDFARSLKEVGRRAAAAVRDDERRVVVVGADKAACEAASHLCGTAVALGFVDADGESALAESLRLPADLRRLVHVLARGHPSVIDALDAGGRFALFGINIGYDADRIARLMRPGLLRGSVKRYAAELSAVRRRASLPVSVRLDEEIETEGEYAAVVVGNTALLPHASSLTPLADPGDGRLDLCLIENRKTRDVRRLTRLARTGEHTAHDGVALFRAKSVRVKIGVPFSCRIDSMEWKSPPQRMTISVRKERLHVLAPEEFSKRPRLSSS